MSFSSQPFFLGGKNNLLRDVWLSQREEGEGMPCHAAAVLICTFSLYTIITVLDAKAICIIIRHVEGL